MLGQPGVERTPDRRRPRRLGRRAAARGRYDGAGGRRGRPPAPATAGVGLRLPRRHLLPRGEEHPWPGADERAGSAGLPVQVFTSFEAVGQALAVPLELGRHLVWGAVDHPRRLGFEPAPDFPDTAGHLGEWTDTSRITFGRDGVPFYVSGPYDNPRVGRPYPGQDLRRGQLPLRRRRGLSTPLPPERRSRRPCTSGTVRVVRRARLYCWARFDHVHAAQPTLVELTGAIVCPRLERVGTWTWEWDSFVAVVTDPDTCVVGGARPSGWRTCWRRSSSPTGRPRLLRHR